MTSHQDTIAFWKGRFGDDYSERNTDDRGRMAQRLAFWAKVLGRIQDKTALGKILEVGCNIGLNIECLKMLVDAEYFAVEPNDKARATVQRNGTLDAAHVLDGSSRALPFADGAFGLAFTVGVLIHVAPGDLEASLREIHRVSGGYILCCEYFADSPTEIPYRGNQGVLFKQDFGSRYLDLFPGLTLLDYGFEWKRTTGMDNLTWWLFKK